jgi:tetratricopeptide (TPR) repeat protein
MAEALDALGPELLDCGRQALAASEKEIAGQCLRMARDIDETADVADLLARVEDRGPPPEPAPVPAPVAESALVPITATKKIRPGMAADTPSLPDLENLLQQEIAGGEIIKGYATLAILKKLPNAAESWRDYKARLDQARKRLVAGYLEKGADLYRDGMIAEARETWQQVLELEPDNALALEKIARADRVLNKLLSLQKAQQKKPPAR